MSRLPIRLRVTLAFAGAMAVLLSGLGLFIYLRFDAAARRRDRPGPALARRRRRGARPGVRRPARRAAGAEPLAEPRRELRPGPHADRQGARLHAPARPEPVLDPRRARSAARPRDRSSIERDAAGRRGPVAAARDPGRGPGGGRLLVVVGTSLDDRDEALASLARLLARSAGRSRCCSPRSPGTCASGAALRPVEAMRTPRGGDLPPREPDERLPVPEAERRDPPARRDAERDARPARGGARARAALRRRRQPRAAHARSPCTRPSSRWRCATAASAERAASAARLGARGGRPADPARRGPARRRPLGGGAACRSSRGRVDVDELLGRGRRRGSSARPPATSRRSW